MTSISSISDLISRFAGPEGQRRLRDALFKQSVFQANVDIVDRVAEMAEIAHYEPDEILIRQGDAASESPNGN